MLTWLMPEMANIWNGLGNSLRISGIAVAALLASGCGLFTETEPDSNLGVHFHGYSATLSSSRIEIQMQVAGRSYLWVGAPSASETRPELLLGIGIRSGQTVSALAILRASTGVELARETVELQIKPRYFHGINFQVGGRNPDTRGFCHHPPTRVPIPGFPGDTLFLWTSGIPKDAIC